MKRATITFFAILLVFTYTKAQNTLLVYTKFPSQLNFIDINNSSIEKKAIWSDKEGGYIINVDQVENTYVESNEDAIFFKLSDQERVTKLIALPSNDRLSLEKCFSSEKYCCEKLTDKQRKSTEKIYAVAVMKKDAETVDYFSFNNPEQEFLPTEDILFSWKSNAEISKLYIVDIKTFDIVYENDNITSNYLTFRSDSKKIKPSEYQLAIEFKEAQYKKQTTDFAIKELVFDNKNYYLPSQKNGTISWKSNLPIKSVSIKESGSDNILYTTNLEISKILLQDIKNDLSTKKAYTVNIETERGNYSYDFEILLDNESVHELSTLIE